MPRTILCPNCGVILNLPDRVTAGKRMKCPKCASRFEVTDRDANSASTPPGVADAMASSHDLARRPVFDDELPLPAADHDLRDIFATPVASAAAIERSAAAPSPSGGGMSDAEALFRDDPVSRRKPRGAEARSQARRCSTCGGVVPMGMSICPSCGLDQETGLRIDLDDLAPPPPPKATGPPLHIAIIGFLCGLVSVVLLLLALIQSVRGEAGITQYGWLCLALVSAVGIFGCVQFLLGKTPKYLMLALTLGLFVNLMAMIAVPIFQVNFDEKDRVVKVNASRPEDPGDVGDAEVEITSIAERMDIQRIKHGLIITGIYVALSIYLMSPPVKKYFIRQAAMAGAVPLY